MYDLSDYAGMIADEVRMRAYADALTRHVTPGCTVLDLGTGVGLHAMMACRLGAAKVFAIETNDAIQVAREHALANGYSDRMVFIHQRSELVSLPAPVDVIVSDLRGALHCSAGTWRLLPMPDNDSWRPTVCCFQRAIEYSQRSLRLHHNTDDLSIAGRRTRTRST